MESEKLLHFWFDETPLEKIFKEDPQFDKEIRDKFLTLHQAAIRGELEHWREQARGKLAEIILLDQLSRNMFRNTPQAFAYDPLSLILSQEAIRAKAGGQLSTDEKGFLYMPFMHSESRLIHQKAVQLFSQKGLEGALKWEIKHKKIIDRFGRYPHRNLILGRESTPEELEFLKQPDSSF